MNTTEAKSLQAVAERVPRMLPKKHFGTRDRFGIFLRTIFAPLATGDKVDADIETLNEVYARASEHRRLTVSRNRLLWVWTSDGHPGKMFWPVIPAAVDLLLSAELFSLALVRWMQLAFSGHFEKPQSPLVPHERLRKPRKGAILPGRGKSRPGI